MVLGKPKTETETLCFLSPFYSISHSASPPYEALLLTLAFLGRYWTESKEKVKIVVPSKTWQGVENIECQSYGFSLLRSHVFLGILGKGYQRQILFLPAYDLCLSLDTTF